MADFNVRSDSVNVELIMEQIRARIREKRGVDYTEAQIQELAAARLEQFIDPGKLRTSLLQEFHRVRAEGDAPEALSDVIDESVLFETHRPWLRGLRKLLRPILKLFLNTKALAALSARSKAELSRRSRDQLTFEVIHNMVIEMTRLGVEVKNLTMRVESMQSRLEFNERRARALEGVVVYKPSEPEPVVQMPRPPMHESRPAAEFRPRQDVQLPHVPAAVQPSSGAPVPAGPDGAGQRSRRRRRRRGRRGGGAGTPGGQPGQPWQQNQPGQQPSPAGSSAPPQNEHEHVDDGPDDGPDSSDDGGGGSDGDPNSQ
jgi:hypothetical protein